MLPQALRTLGARPGLLQRWKALASQAPGCTRAPFQRALSTFSNELSFHKAADEALMSMQDNLSWMEDQYDLEISMSQGVLKLETPNDGIW